MNNLYEEHVVKPIRKRVLAHIIGILLGMVLYPFSQMLGSIFVFVSIGAVVPTLKQLNAVKRNKKTATICEEGDDQLKATTDDGIEIHLPKGHACVDKAVHKEVDYYFMRLGVICGRPTQDQPQNCP